MSQLNWTPDPPNGKDEQGNYTLSQCHVPYWDESGEKKILFVIWTDKEGTSFNLQCKCIELRQFETIQEAKESAQRFYAKLIHKSQYNFTNPNL